MQQENGSSIYFRLSTRPIPQIEREISPTLEKDIIAGAYWASPVSKKTKIVIIYCGTVAPEGIIFSFFSKFCKYDNWFFFLKAIQGLNQLLEQRGNEVSLMAVTSPQVLYQDWQEVSFQFLIFFRKKRKKTHDLLINCLERKWVSYFSAIRR